MGDYMMDANKLTEAMHKEYSFDLINLHVAGKGR
jgi:hypothetical protein